MKIATLSVKHSAILSMILLALAVFGFFSIASTNMEFIPDIDMPQIFVVAVYPGASAEDVESDVVDVLEDNFVTLPDFKSMDSQSMNSAAMITITFQDGVNPEDQLNEVRNRISQMMSDLPSGLQGEPTALVGGATMLPIVSFSVESSGDTASLSEYINDTLRPQLTRIPGVSTITISGSMEPEVSVKLRMDDLNARGISPLTVYQILSASNISMPLDTAIAEGRRIDLRFDGRYESLDEIKALPVGGTDSGEIIRLSDVADVSLSYPGEDYYVTSEGKDIIVVEVAKRADGNTIQITNAVKDVLDEAVKETGGALEFHMIKDDSELVLSSLKNVIESGVLGILIAVLIIFLFINDAKATLAIGLSIPLSCFFTFIVMKVAGITINILSISGIVVSLGSIVDASIVVLDQIYRYYQDTDENGKGKYTVVESIYKGTGVVDKSVIGSNLTTVVVFIPVVLLSGLVGDILHDISLTFMFAIGSSLVVAMVYMPYLLKHFLKDDGVRLKKKDSFAVKGLIQVEKGYGKALGFCMEHTPFIIVIALLVLALTIYSLTSVNISFIPSTDNNDFYISIDFPTGYTLEETREAMDEAERILYEKVPETETAIVYSGKSVDALTVSNSENVGGMHVVLVPVADRDRDIHEIILEMQYALSAAIPDADVQVKNGGFDYLVGYMSGGGGYGLTLIGEDEHVLFEYAEGLRDFLLTEPEVVSAEISSEYDSTAAVMNASYEYLSSLGLSATEAAMTSAIVFNGMDTGIYLDPDTDQRYNINLSTDAADVPVSQQMLESLKLYTQAGSVVSMDAVADLEMETELSSISHTDRAVSLTVSAQLTGESTTDIQRRVSEYIAANPLPDGVTTDVGGIDELIGDSMGPLMQALLISLFLVYMVIVLIYERFDQPFLIMLTVPFCVIGVVLSLAVFGSSMSMVSLLGVVTLGGMLVNNGIILVDYINQLEGESRDKAAKERGITIKEGESLLGRLSYETEMAMLFDNIKRGTATRLRPILMSSLTTILGVIPMAFAKGEGSEIYAPLGQVIMGGLTTSTFITLFLMPTFYFILERHKIRKACDWTRKEDKKI
ncbi:MAG: efflux RND transporter permease subunit [Spirochaetes bacterium]|uniref:Efflux RND transporter permease subunit n=1 Tax=Candidatus Ornithospirochaeta stercoripullorum TaxID=2840899 RepID=A0A9D9E290_9SPIO|nr:efflux RND transporter permease subunit [Candidatus Ornithospirochaeta stercoripullorum]